MLGLLVTAGNCTYHEAGQMTLTEFNSLVRYWNRHPPVHLLIGGILTAFGAASSDAPAPTPSNGAPEHRLPPPPANAPNWKTESFESLVSRWGGLEGAGFR